MRGWGSFQVERAVWARALCWVGTVSGLYEGLKGFRGGRRGRVDGDQAVLRTFVLCCFHKSSGKQLKGFK